MQAVLHQLFLSTSILVVCALALGLVFERLPAGERRNASVGALCGVFALFVMSMPISVGGYSVDGRAPLLIAAGLFGGPVGALAAIPLPLALRAELGGPGVVAGFVVILGAALLGVGTRAFIDAREIVLSRRIILAVAAASPLLVLSVLAPFTSDADRALDELIVPLVLFLPFGTAVLGLVTLNELRRADHVRAANTHARFLCENDLISKEHFLAKVAHHASLNERYGVHYAVLIVSMDNAVAVRAEAQAAAWLEIQSAVAQTVRTSLRDSDVCAVLDFDRIGVLLPYTGPISAYAVSQRIAAAVSETVSFGGNPLTVSIGAGHVDHAATPDAVLQDAEAELFRALARTPRGAIGPRPGPEQMAPSSLSCFPGAIAMDDAANDFGEPGRGVAGPAPTERRNRSMAAVP